MCGFSLAVLSLVQVNAPVAVKGSSLELCKKACAHQRAKDLTEQASALLAKDKQIEALQQECWELQAKLTAGKVSVFLGFYSLAWTVFSFQMSSV